MIELTFESSGKERCWSFERRNIRVGSDPSCDVALPADEFPMVSRSHLLVGTEGDRCWVEDLNSTSGTFLSGRRVQRAELLPGDILRLGVNGPELRFQFARAAGDAPKKLVDNLDIAPTLPGKIEAQGEQAPQGGEAPSRLFRGAQAGEEFSFGEKAMIEQKLNALRNLVGVLLLLILILGGVVLYQVQQINENRNTLLGMERKAEGALGQFMPTLEQRLNGFEQRVSEVQATVNGMDDKIKQAEDRFVRRLDHEFPRMLDRYVKTKLQEWESRLQRLERAPEAQRR